ncbi:MAG: hypothetical protein GQ559_01775 [Desulfobulbaceae bacterium]|nr:hypothetical protein [Desulfobulbaceae bacterium]
MHRFICFFIMLSLLAIMVGCIRTPQPEGYPFTIQHKMQAAHHWDVLANDVANQVNNELIRRGYLETPVYVKHSCGQPDNCGPGETFPFDEGFNDLLATQLVNFGVPTLAENDDSGLVIDYKVQVLYHRDTRYQWPRPGVLTALTAGIVVFRNAPAEIAAVIAAAAIDGLGATSVIKGHYEVLISTSIVRDNIFLMRKSDIYYINDPDFWHYQKSTPAAEIELTSSRY